MKKRFLAALLSLWETSGISVKKKIWGIRPTKSFTDCHMTDCTSCWTIN